MSFEQAPPVGLIKMAKLSDFVLKYDYPKRESFIAVPEWNKRLWLISNDLYDRLKFCIFAWLGWNPDYALVLWWKNPKFPNIKLLFNHLL